MLELSEIQTALADARLDGWLFCDFHRRDPLAYRILGLDPDAMTSRRWFYLVPCEGQPIKLTHRVEPRRLDGLPGDSRLYLSYVDLHERLREIVAGHGKLAMQYSPNNDVPYVSTVDAGTVELVRSFGVEVVSSADLVQRFEAVTDERGLDGHREAGRRVQAIKDQAFQGMDEALRKGQSITEFDVCRFVLERFASDGLVTDGVPIVGFNDHPADPHFEPTELNAYDLHHGDTILLDLWARLREPPGLYYDVTWCGFAGQTPPPLYRQIWDVVCEARDAGLEFVRRQFERGEPTRGRDVDDVVREVVRRLGFAEAFLHRTGHSIGVDSVHGNGANIDNLETRDDRLLVPGTCFSIEPGIYLEGRMAVRTEINVLLTLEGAVEVVGPIQDELLHIG